MSKKPIAIIGARDTGKTYRLHQIFIKANQSGKRVLVIDSATDHISKSLLKKLEKDYEHELIYTNDERKIVFPNVDKNSYPNGIQIEKISKVFLCDAGFFLERGYDYPTGIEREKQRKLYKYFSMQVISVLIDNIDVILMDEIELMPEFGSLIKTLILKNKDLVLALHDEKGLAGMEALFSIERI